ncbi:ABC transporter permease [Corynebacterium sp. HMSC071B10]|uniref:ABC transporter permease n=1 Tax=Corynebacterium sp. HMSC071B10 TaxID=1739494 RepID=UPI0008A1F93D|nr:ABC transporter permease [Corynebacterium sp. HMSC071B10]OFP34593.1 peptide ABC transporter permease [Corynebacterium sp. HMSC071B10]
MTRTNTSRALGWVLIGTAAVAALVSLVWTPYDPLHADPAVRLASPSWQHWMGTDALGRDIASRIMHGARFTLSVACAAVACSALIGVPLGVLAGMRRRAGHAVMAGADLLLAFPALLLAIVFTAVFGASTWVVIAAVGIAGIPGFVRVARVGTMQIMHQDYILAARISGVPALRIATRHVLPNIAPIITVQISTALALAILAEAGLSFLGLGTPAPYASWGRMLQASQPYLATSPHLALWPGFAISLTVLGFNLLGDRRTP